MQRSSRKQLTFLTHKLPTTRETCKALQTPFLPRPLRPGPLPAPAPTTHPHPRRAGARGGSPAPSSAFCPRARALELAHGRTGHAQRRPRGQPRFAGARTQRRAGSRLQLELQRPELELPGVSPPTPPSSRAAAGAGAGGASGGQPAPAQAELVRSPEPRTGQFPGRSLAGWDACGALALPGHKPRCKVGPGLGEPGRGQAGAGGMRLQQPWLLERPARCLMRVARLGTPLRGGGSRQAPQGDAFKLAGGGRGGCVLGCSCFVLAERDSGPWFPPPPRPSAPPNLGPGVRAGLGKPQSGAVCFEKVEERALLSSLSPR